ncbi:MAG: toprim domain-containing protein [Nanoarchaeota archaeon]|nr:toprim domain-containing protein [Nanoarchaeota archaeon]MBU1946338.1 toprim domain-containing protein [Nanoarchaeota archaeon]
MIKMRKEVEELLGWVEKLKEDSKLIIVEGKEDKMALGNLGLVNVIQLGRKPLYKVVEIVVKKGEEVIILTDLDKEGKKIYARLNHELGQFGVKIDNRFRNFLFKSTQLRQIEGLDSYINRLEIKG